MGENIPLTSTTSETEGSYSSPPLFEHTQPAERAEKHQHAEQWAQDGDAKVTVSERLVSHAVDSPSLKAEPQEEQAEARKAAGKTPHQSFDDLTAGGWNDFDKSSAIFNFNERPVRDAGWRFVFAVPLVVLLVAVIHVFYALSDTSTLLGFSPFLYPVALILCFAVSLPLPVLIVSSLRKIPARVLNALLILTAVVCALQSATSAVHYFALVPSDGESGETNEGSGGMMAGGMGEEEESAMMDSIMADEAMKGTEGGMVGGMEGGTEGAMGDNMEGQEDPSEAAGSSAADAAAEAESTDSAPTSGSSSAAATSDLGRGLLELALPAVAHPVVTVSAQHAAYWVRAVHSTVRRHLQSHASDAEKRARGRSLQGDWLFSEALILCAIFFIAFVVLGLLSVVALLLVLRCNHHLPLAASAVAHAAQTTVSQTPVIFLMPLPVILAASFLGLPLMYSSIDGGANIILFVLLLPTSLFVARVLSALLTYSTAAVYARLYVTTSGSSSRSSSEDGKAGEKEEGVTLRGQLDLFSSALTLACTSSLGTCCAVAFTACTATIAQLLLSALSLALFGQGVLGCLLVALLHCTQIVIQFFLSYLVLPTSAMSGHGFARSLRLCLDILQRFLAPIFTANAAGLALLAMLTVPIGIIYDIIGIIGVFAYQALFPPDLALFLEAFFTVYVVSLLSVVALSSVLTTGVATTVLCFAWDKKLEPEEGSDAAGLVGGGHMSSADVKDTSAV
ncbi:unnamed protein product [Closterium sp. Naga37s-1]|nr:unnamed protein product [Closterium sp. Naga37s-1]